MFNNSNPSINMTVVGFGQAGTRMVDRFARIKDNENNFVYNPLALNSNDGDLQELKYVPKENRISLKLGGLGKNPEKAVAVLEENQEARERLKDFVRGRVRPKDDLVLFFAGLGGGTGTSTIVKAVEEYVEHYNKPIIQEEIKKVRQTDLYKQNPKKAQAHAIKKAEERFTKIGIVVTLPVRSDGPDVLRQVNDFANRLWKLAKNRVNGVAFISFADNQFFYDKWRENESIKNKFENYRDFANNEIFNSFHELNMATNSGNTDVVMDRQDFRRIVLEGTGSFVIGKMTRDNREITNSQDLKEMFLKASKSSSLHDPINLEEKDEEGTVTAAKVFHVGLLAVVDKAITNKLGSSFLDEAKEEVTEDLPLQGTVFTGYLDGKTGFNATVYAFYKTHGLPSRLSKGLVDEFNEFRKKQKAIKFKTDSIDQIAATEEEEDFDFDLSGLGLDDDEIAVTQDDNEEEDIDIDNLDFSDVEDYDFEDDDTKK